ncbi:E3 ubiquitin-protein ligase RNF8-B-like [Asbolus verrucosus]|uniref:E3 ubiquitin-protein ligase CHFR n=1 Tax=Asbolus verrucosus TaxID=1661398 RepID=A0A482VSY2_ASBVE|nr:E3 ubiquitin-protein ligase RNF8-B-like [Asbolus verrucosus]
MDEFPKLVNSHDDSTITINNSSFSIGRSLSCDHIIQSLGVSRFHCIIKKNDDKWTLFDRSTNGTIVNSTLYKFNESVDLSDGDVIKLGPDNLDFVFTNSEVQRSKINDTGSSMVIEEASPVNPATTPLFPNDEVLLEEAASLLADGLEETGESVKTSKLQTELTPQNAETKEDKSKNETGQSLDIMENELTCSICSELFIKAVTLNCSHTFCKFCIEEWKKNKSSCPICRKFITTVAPTLVLDNFIEKIISTQDDEVKETRKVLIQQREEVTVNTASSSSNVATSTSVTFEGGSVIEIFSEDDDEDEEDSDYNYFSDDHDYDVYDCYFDNRPYVGSRGRYYGGYGRCFICSQPGHWANSCPFKRR